VTLVDTPGLDALDHDEHEKLTLEVFLPTVDAVMFAASVKGNSDKKIEEYASVIAAKKKPVILVQTMRDTVLPKLGIGASVLKSEAQVAVEHELRIRRVLEQSGHRDAAVVQVAAVTGFGVDALVASTHDELERLRPTIERGRLRQLIDHVRRLRDVEGAKLGPPGESASDVEPELKRTRARVDELLSGGETDLAKALTDAKTRADALLAAAAGLSPRASGAAARVGREIDQFDGIAGLRAALAGLDGKLAAEAQSLNFRPEDYLMPPPRTAELRASINITIRTERVEAKGVGAWFARHLWGGGYTEHEVVDLEQLVRDAGRDLDAELGRCRHAAATIRTELEKRVAALVAECDRRVRDLAAKRRVALVLSQHVEAVDALAALVGQIEVAERALPSSPSARPRPSAAPPSQEPHDEIRVSQLTVDVLRLSFELAQQRFVALREHTWPNRGNQQRPVIWGWDHETIERVVGRFWGDHEVRRGPPGIATLWRDGHERGWLVDENEVAGDAKAHLMKTLRDVGRDGLTLFPVLDAQQPGSAGSLWVRSPLRQELRPSRVFVVMQAVHALRRSSEGDASEAGADAFVAALHEILALARREGLRIDGALADDDDVGVSYLAHRLLTEGDSLCTHADETKWIAEIDPMSNATTAPYLQRWRASAVERTKRRDRL
jgi:hypothetical protein